MKKNKVKAGDTLKVGMINAACTMADYCLGDLTVVSPPQMPWAPMPLPVLSTQKEKQKEKTMYCDDMDCGNNLNVTDRADAAKREYLSYRLNSVSDSLQRKARVHFGMADEDAPETWEQFIARIQSGKFLIKESYKDKCWAYDSYGIRWRDPAKVADNAGYQATYAKIMADMRDVEDVIAILEPADALKAVKEFEAKTYH